MTCHANIEQDYGFRDRRLLIEQHQRNERALERWRRRIEQNRRVEHDAEFARRFAQSLRADRIAERVAPVVAAFIIVGFVIGILSVVK